jgi:hypothetical protein
LSVPSKIFLTFLWKSEWRALKKLKIKMPNDPKESKSVNYKDTCILTFITALVTRAKL